MGLDNGMAPTRQQTIIWTKDGKIIDANMCPSAPNELMMSTVSN